jgi:D-3-phosphoglycerate dehydrogenase
VGTILGKAKINIASFVLGRDGDGAHAVAVVNTDGEIPEDVMQEIQNIPAVQFLLLVRL